MPILETTRTLLTSRYNRSLKITSSKYIFSLELLACLAQHPSAFTSRCRRDKEERGALEPPVAEDFYVFRSFKPCRHQAKQTNAQALQTSSKINALEYATAKFKTLATTTAWKDANFRNHPGAADVKIQPKYQDYLLEYNIFATSRLSRSASVRVHVEVRNGYGRARGVGAAPRRRRSNETI